MESNALFDNYKYCSCCKKPLPLSYKKDMCPFCIEQSLFHEVKDYIRSNDVTEYDVSEHFHIPLHQVKKWVKEGRIEYKESAVKNSIVSNHCQHCGAPVSFGTLCPKCLKLMNSSGHSTVASAEASHMRFLDSADDK